MPIKQIIIIIYLTAFWTIEQTVGVIFNQTCLITNILKIYPNKTIQTIDQYIYAPNEYISIQNDDSIAPNYYNKDCLCTGGHVCVRKCCSNTDWYERNESVSVCKTRPNNVTLNLHFYKDSELVQTNRTVLIIPGAPCKSKYKLTDSDLKYLQLSGELYVFENDYQYKSLNDYCVDIMYDYQKHRNVDPKVLNNTFYLCFEDVLPPDKFIVTIATGMIISIPFLFLTFAVYAIIPELQNLHGKSLMCYVFTLMIAYTLLAFIQLRPTQPPPFCEIIAFSIYFLFLVSFFWLNVMCFDIWWTFSGSRGFRGRKSEKSGMTKFLFYHLYAWGVPTLILTFTLFVHFYPNIPNGFPTPQIGSYACWFIDKTTTLLYFHLPLFFVILSNLCFFICTAIKIIKIKRETSMLKTKDSKRHENSSFTKDKQRFNLYLKLFIVMGVNWTMELISLISNGPDGQLAYIWVLTDLANTLHGVLIFIIFVCKRQIWNLLVKRYYVLRGKPYLANTTLSRTQTTTYSTSQVTDAVPSEVNQSVSIKLNNFN